MGTLFAKLKNKIDGYRSKFGAANDIRSRAIYLATKFLQEEEKCYLHAYPDPASPMGKALGSRGIFQIGLTGIIPQHVAHLSGKPWTIGWGQTGTRVHQNTKWTQQQADTVLQTAVENLYTQINEVWPGSHRLQAGAQAALISLVYNRGSSLIRKEDDVLDRRWEMRELGPAIINQNYMRMSELFWSMRRLWLNNGLGGLVKRREAESRLIMVV